jgi:outer membrane protein
MSLSMTRTTLAVLALALPTFLAATSASADDTQNNELRVGSYTVFYHAKADDLAGPYVPAGVNFHVENLETIYVGYIRHLSTHFDFELALGAPPVTKTQGRGPATVGSVAYNGQVISTARWLAPTALVEYKFFDASAALRPFIGVGINYTNFYDRNSTAAGNAASGGPTKISLPSSIGPAATIGATYQFAPRWTATASYSASKVSSKLTADTAGVVRTSHIDFNPQALIVSVGYAF